MKGRMHSLRVLIALVVAACIAAPAVASTYLDLDDDAYAMLSRLETEGVISTGLLSTRPISRKAALRLLREAEDNAEGRSAFIRDLIAVLKQRIKPEGFGSGGLKYAGSVYAKYMSTNADVMTLSYYPGPAREKEHPFNYNNDGDLYERGSNYRAGLTWRMEDLGPLSLYVNPELRYSDNEEKEVLKKGYAVVGFSWLDIVVGRDSAWWGPGYHGAILLSDNAEPLTMLKFTGPEPLRLPWIFKYLGPFQYTVFATRLEKDRSDYPEPYLWGMRFDFKPWPFLEIGLERTALLGGRGRPTNAATWRHSVLGSNEHESTDNPGDQRAGFDLKLTLPFSMQPVQVYWEQAGEEDRQRNSRRPYKLANLYGLYLPRVLGFERVELRAEYAETKVNEQNDVWYTHGTYTAGYTYHGVIMGHHMGTESKDFFLELSYLMPEKDARLFLSYDREAHDLSGPSGETATVLTITAEFPLSRQVRIRASGGYGRIKNPGNMPADALNVHQVSSEIRYSF